MVHIYGPPYLKGAAKARAAEVLEIARRKKIPAADVLKYLNKHSEDAFRKNDGEPPQPKTKSLTKKQAKKVYDSWVQSKQWRGSVSLPGKSPRKKKGPVLIFGYQDADGKVQMLDAVKADSSLFLNLLRAHSKRLTPEKKSKIAQKPKPKSSAAPLQKSSSGLPGLEELRKKIKEG